MAEKRMFTKKITESDSFLDMPSSSQMLYFHLSMSADDDGFVNSPKKIQRMCGASDDDMKLLIMKSFIIAFESGIIVIKHWRMHNYIQSDRYKPTDYIEEKSMLSLKKNKAYTLNGNNLYTEVDTECIQSVHVDKNRLDKNSIVEDSIDNNINIYIRDIVEYLNEKTGSSYRSSTDKTRERIKARLNEGFSVDDFKTVIDAKTREWLNDARMRQYLRPETLFGTKFESYLNNAHVDDACNDENDWRDF